MTRMRLEETVSKKYIIDVLVKVHVVHKFHGIDGN